MGTKTPEEILRELEGFAAHLASKNYFYSAFVIMRNYDGPHAAVTELARREKAETYLTLARKEHSSDPTPWYGNKQFGMLDFGRTTADEIELN